MMRRASSWGSALIGVAALAALAAAVGARSEGEVPVPSSPDRARFRIWLNALENRDANTSGLYPYFKSDEAEFERSPDHFLSTMVTAKCILFWLGEGEDQRAVRIGKGLLRWQRKVATWVHPRAAGALPSQIVWVDGKWTGGDRFYSGDNLVILEAFLALYEKTLDSEFLDGAGLIARWLKDVMGHGEKHGAWLEPYFAPMHFVTARGDFDNRVYTNTEFLWITALRHYGEVAGDRDYVEHYLLARSFFLQGQSSYGVWYDHYDPGFPPHHYQASNWRWFGKDGVVIADNAMRAALGALRVGAPDRAERFARWLRPDNGAVFAYLDARSGKPRFATSDAPYFDVVVSGLWRNLAAALGRDKAVAATERFLARTQSADGGWYWGRRKNGLEPVQRSEAVLTGYWAVNRVTN